jgi:hypothetical protein
MKTANTTEIGTSLLHGAVKEHVAVKPLKRTRTQGTRTWPQRPYSILWEKRKPEQYDDCAQCGKRKHTVWKDDAVRACCGICVNRDKVIAIAHSAKAFDLHFILKMAILLKWQPELVMNELKVMCMKVEQITFLGSVIHTFLYINCPTHSAWIPGNRGIFIIQYARKRGLCRSHTRRFILRRA